MRTLYALSIAVIAVGFLSVVTLRDEGCSDQSISTAISATDEFTLRPDAGLLGRTEVQLDPQQISDDFHAIQSEVQTDVRIDLVGEESQHLDADLAIWESHEDDQEPLNIGDDLDADGPEYVLGNLTEVVEIGEFIDADAVP